jgi:xanthine dehydrogenase small subunit
VRAYKISKRFDCDISAVCAGLAIELDANGTVTVARLAFGGMAATVRRATGAEAKLIGQPWDEAAVASAQAALAGDFVPLTDMRASAAYRLQVARNLLRRLWLETRPSAPLTASESSVWSSMTHVVPAPHAEATP